MPKIVLVVFLDSFSRYRQRPNLASSSDVYYYDILNHRDGPSELFPYVRVSSLYRNTNYLR